MRSRRFRAVWNRTANPVVRLVLRSPLEQLRQEAETALSIFAGRDSHALGASAFKRAASRNGPTRGSEGRPRQGAR
jgi:hypothetical protein